MLVIRLLFATFIVCSLIISCNNSNPNQFKEPFEIDSIFTPLGGIYGKDTLSVEARFSECGEWGGHLEYLSIQWDKNNKLYARLVIDSVNCDRLYFSKNLNDFKHTVFDSTKYLTPDDEYLISTMLQKVLKAHLIGYGIAGANYGNSYHIRTSDGSFELDFWNSGNTYNEINFVDTMNKIFGDVKRQKEDY